MTIFQEMQNGSELKGNENNQNAINREMNKPVEIIEEKYKDSVKKEPSIILPNTVEDDPLLAAVKAFEEANAKIEVWTTPDEFFGSIRSVQPGSLADSYGILDCDRIIQFGDLNTTTFRDLKQFGEYYGSVRGKDIMVGIFVVIENLYSR